MTQADALMHRVHALYRNVVELVCDESGAPLSDDEIELLLRVGNEPGSWEVLR